MGEEISSLWDFPCGRKWEKGGSFPVGKKKISVKEISCGNGGSFPEKGGNFLV